MYTYTYTRIYICIYIYIRIRIYIYIYIYISSRREHDLPLPVSSILVMTIFLFQCLPLSSQRSSSLESDIVVTSLSYTSQSETSRSISYKGEGKSGKGRGGRGGQTKRVNGVGSGSKDENTRLWLLLRIPYPAYGPLAILWGGQMYLFSPGVSRRDADWDQYINQNEKDRQHCFCNVCFVV